MKPPLFSNLRDWIMFFIGTIWGVLFTQFMINQHNIMPWLKKNVALDQLKKEYQGPFYFRIRDIKNRPPKKQRLRTLFPPPHAGGNPGNQAYIWAHTELIERRKLSKPEAWLEFQKQYPSSHDPLLAQNDRENFYKAMERYKKKARKGDKTTRK